MRILLTGATGYIGKRLLPILLEDGHNVIACVRDRTSLDTDDISPEHQDQIEIFQVDFLKEIDLDAAPKVFDVAFYLIHSMSSSMSNFDELELKAARNFGDYLDQTQARQIIYLSGIVNEDKLSKHLESRLQVEKTLNQSKVPLTPLRAVLHLRSLGI